MWFFRLIRQIHLAIKARSTRYFRVREVERVFRAAHASELSLAPAQNWPLLKAQHAQQIREVRAGNLQIVDRKSWAFPYLPACLDEETEILTRRGFIPVAEMRKEDVFATRHPVTHRFEWESATGITRSRYKGDMVRIAGQQADALLTPNHRVIARVKLKAGNRTVAIANESELLASELEVETRRHRNIYELPLTALPERSEATVAEFVRLVLIKRNIQDINSFVEWLVKTDGYTPHDIEHQREYGTTSPQFAEDVVEILIRLGYQVGMTTRSMECGSTFYRIAFSRKAYCDVRAIERVSYDGYVYCPSVPNGVVCVRRNGKIHWTGNSVQRLSMPVAKCYAADTEVLTLNGGWKRIDTVTVADRLATLSRKGEFQWRYPKRIYDYAYKGKMAHFNSKGVDLLVTPNHRMYGRTVKQNMVSLKHEYGDVGFLTAEEVLELPRKNNSYPFQIPLAASSWKGQLPRGGTKVSFAADRCAHAGGAPPKSYEMHLMDYVAFLGIWLAEGYTNGTMHGIDFSDSMPLAEQARRAEESGIRDEWVPPQFRGYGVGVCQSRGGKLDVVALLMDRLPFAFRYKKSGNGFLCISKALWEDLHPLGNKYTKRIPQWIKNLPPEYLRELVRWMLVGDGHILKDQRVPRQDGNGIGAFMYATASKQLADDFTEILQKIGIGSYMHTIPADETKEIRIRDGRAPRVGHGAAEFYHVYAARLQWVGAGGKMVDYDGMIYCPHIPPYNTLLVRRNGKAAWCGNSSPYNLRRFGRTPIARRAINLIKNSITSQPWDIRAIENASEDTQDDREWRIRVAKSCLRHPNKVDSVQSWLEQGIEDICTLGAFASEIRMTPDPERPFKLWCVDVSTVRIFVSWSESTPDLPHYAQMTGLQGERGAILFYDDELMYVRDNPATDNPFGLGKLEVSFQSLNDLLGVQRMAGMAGADQIHKTWMWWEQPQTDCHGDDTEVLTRRGWLLWKDVRETDLLATRNSDSEFEWQLPTALQRAHYKGDMVEFNNRSLSILVTPKHRMYGQYFYDKRNRHTGIYSKQMSEMAFAHAGDIWNAVYERPGSSVRYVGNETAMLTASVKCHADGPDPTCVRCQKRLAMRRLRDRKRAGITCTPPPLTPTDFRIPMRSVWHGELLSERFELGRHSFAWEDWAAFLGIWIAEGHTSGSMQGVCSMRAAGDLRPVNLLAVEALASGAALTAQIAYAERTHSFKVGISQSKTAHPKEHAQIKALLERMGFDVYENGHVLFFTDRDVWSYLTQFGNKYTKFIPDQMKNVPVDLLLTLVDWACIGDGWIGPGGRRGYGTASRRLADDMQEVFQKIGTSVSIQIRQQGRAVIEGRSCETVEFYSLQENDSDAVGLFPGVTRGRTSSVPRRVPYDGMVYCATVPNGVLYTRRNGKPFWSGNSAYQIVRRHIQNELEGQAKVSIIGGMKKPEIVEVQPVSIDDLLLPWQEMLIRIVANGFDISAMALNITNDVNRAVGQVLDDKDFRSAVVPMAHRLQEGITRKILHEKMGWYDLEFVFLNLDDPDLETKTDMYARMYSGNALIPNEWREGMGMQPLDSVFANLTQYESMMLNMELMAKLQAGTAAGQGGPGGGQGGGPPVSQGDISRGGQVESPKPLLLPKFPVAGSKWNAKQIAMMPVNDLSDRIDGGELPAPKKLLRDMTAQDPTILDQMSDEVRQYFEDRLNEEEKEQKGEDAKPKDLKKWVKSLRKKVSEQNTRNDSMTEYLTDIARMRAIHKGKMDKQQPYRAVRNVGKPGTPPPSRGV